MIIRLIHSLKSLKHQDVVLHVDKPVQVKYPNIYNLDCQILTIFFNLVHEQKFDAVVGDTTIVANRSIYVDFTLPYTESGVSMIVPVKDSKSKSAWIFLKPLTWDLWMTSACFFVFIGFVIWVLEHRINEDFRGPPSHQAGTIFWFSFSTMVFAQSKFHLFPEIMYLRFS